MREISLNTPDSQLPVYSLLQYGDTRTGKTYHAATWPRPFIFADVAESGYKTIMSMDRNDWFEPNVEPIVVGIDNMADVANTEPRLNTLIASGRICTIVFDSFTFYADFFLAKLLARKKSA